MGFQAENVKDFPLYKAVIWLHKTLDIAREPCGLFKSPLWKTEDCNGRVDTTFPYLCVNTMHITLGKWPTVPIISRTVYSDLKGAALANECNVMKCMNVGKSQLPETTRSDHRMLIHMPRK